MVKRKTVIGLSRHLRTSFPDEQVTVRRVKLKDWGYCQKLDDGSFLIQLEKTADRHTQIDTLIHEWAHVLSWEVDNHPSDHGKAFGIAYAKVYQSYLDWV